METAKLVTLARMTMALLDYLSGRVDNLYKTDPNMAIRAKGRLIDAKAKIGAFIDIIDTKTEIKR